MSIYLFLHSNDNLKFLRFQEIESQASVNASLQLAYGGSPPFAQATICLAGFAPACSNLEQSSAFLLPADMGVTILHHVSDVIQSNLKWRINPNSPAKIQKKIEIQKIMNNIFKKITNLFFTTTIYYLATLPENIDTFLRK